MKFTVTGLLLLTSVCHSQLNTTIYQQAIPTPPSMTPVQAAPFRSSVLRNINSQYQQLTVYTTDATGGNNQCVNNQTVGLMDIHLEASFDNTNWFPIGSRLIQPLYHQYQYVSVAGAFPYLTVYFGSNTTTGGGGGGAVSCAFQAWYAGTVSGTPTTNLGFTYTKSGATSSPSTYTLTCPSGSILGVYGLQVNNGAGGALVGTITDAGSSAVLLNYTVAANASAQILVPTGVPYVFNRATNSVIFNPLATSTFGFTVNWSCN